MDRGFAPKDTKGQPGLFQAALFRMCPQCASPTLFKAPAKVADTCRVCGQELAGLERGQRLAGLLTIMVAALLITGALALDTFVRPPLWLHGVIWLPVTIGSVLGVLRLFKTASIYRAYLLADEVEQ